MASMPRRNEEWARESWDGAMVEHSWKSRTVAKVMFDWTNGKRTTYHPKPPAFWSITDEHGTVDQQEYLDLQNALIRVGEERSNAGRRRHSRNPAPIKVPFSPAPISQEDVRGTIRAVMSCVHPAVVRQEQIMRCAFIAHLPEEARTRIGTLSANLHPELPTPSKEYQRKGQTKRRARIDLGVGHHSRCDQIAGVLELKRLNAFSAIWFEKQLGELTSTRPGLMFSGLAGDFQKLLDPKLPTAALRFSWAVTSKRGLMTPNEVAAWARRLIEPVEQRLELTGFKQSYDDSIPCVCWTWPDRAVVHLAWYWPKIDAPGEFEPIWMQE